MKLKLTVRHGAPQDQTVNAHCFPLVTLHDSAHACVAISINDIEQCAVHSLYSYLWFWPLPRNTGTFLREAVLLDWTHTERGSNFLWTKKSSAYSIFTWNKSGDEFSTQAGTVMKDCKLSYMPIKYDFQNHCFFPTLLHTVKNSTKWDIFRIGLNVSVVCMQYQN
jgi:hypothetical protein